MITSDPDNVGETDEETAEENETMMCKRVVTRVVNCVVVGLVKSGHLPSEVR